LKSIPAATSKLAARDVMTELLWLNGVLRQFDIWAATGREQRTSRRWTSDTENKTNRNLWRPQLSKLKAQINWKIAMNMENFPLSLVASCFDKLNNTKSS
jgi:hypothetical protein